MSMVKAKGTAGYGVQAVILALKILELLATSRAARGVTELASELGTTKPRVFRHLRTLSQCGYVVQEADSGKYRSGARMMVLAQAVGEHLDIVTSARPVMRRLHERLGHTGLLAGIENDGVRILEVLLGKSDLQVSQRAGTKIGFHYSALGKIALAYGPPELHERVTARPLEPRTPHTIVTVAALRRELQAIRSRGWAHAPDENVIGLNTLAAPIFDGHGRLAGMLGILGTIQFIPGVPSPMQINAVMTAARDISKALGYRPSRSRPGEAANDHRRNANTESLQDASSQSAQRARHRRLK